MLSGCAKELIRYILGMEENSAVVAELDDWTFIVNCNKYIGINSENYGTHIIGMLESGEYYYVCYEPSGVFDLKKSKEFHAIYLSMKKLREICVKYQSDNPIYLQYMQYLDEQERWIQTTLQKPMDQWKDDDYQALTLHLLEDSVVDASGEIKGCTGCHINSWERQNITFGLAWYYISEDELRSMGVSEQIRTIYLNSAFKKIDFGFAKTNDANADQYIQKLRDFINNICPMPITFDMSNYKEKFQLAQSIMDRLAAEFKL